MKKLTALVLYYRVNKLTALALYYLWPGYSWGGDLFEYWHFDSHDWHSSPEVLLVPQNRGETLAQECRNHMIGCWKYPFNNYSPRWNEILYMFNCRIVAHWKLFWRSTKELHFRLLENWYIYCNKYILIFWYIIILSRIP